MTDTAPIVPFDSEIAPILVAMAAAGGEQMTRESIVAGRGASLSFPDVATVIGDRAIDWEDREVPGPDGAPALTVTILRPRGIVAPVPGLYNIHGGGMVVGQRGMDTPRLADLVDELGVVAVNVEYRLAPEHPFPAGSEDCYAGLLWTVANAPELGIDPERLMVMGGSAGGGFSAAVALMARDRKGPHIAGQLLLCPMLDDRQTTTSSHQYSGLGTWPREANTVAWDCVLGEQSGGADVSPYAAPARATDLSELPPAYIEAGSAETFRDEDVEYATRIWATGGQAELHIWSGGFHGFDVFAPDSAIARAALAARSSWLRRILGL